MFRLSGRGMPIFSISFLRWFLTSMEEVVYGIGSETDKDVRDTAGKQLG